MSTERRNRVERVMQVRSRALDIARGDLATASREVLRIELEHEAAVTLWLERANLPVGMTFERTEMFADQREHIDSLRKRVEQLEKNLMSARAREAACRERAKRAQQELKKIETWRDSLDAQIREQESRRERKTTDELAARRLGRDA